MTVQISKTFLNLFLLRIGPEWFGIMSTRLFDIILVVLVIMELLCSQCGGVGVQICHIIFCQICELKYFDQMV